MSTARRIADRYAARRILPLVIDRDRIHRWVEGVTGKTVRRSMLAGQGPAFKLSVIFDDGSQVNYEITFTFDLTPTGIEMHPRLRAISPLHG